MALSRQPGASIQMCSEEVFADHGPPDPQGQYLSAYLWTFGGSGSWRLKGFAPNVLQNSDKYGK